MTLTEFLLARVAEDEAVARAAVIPTHDAPNAYQPHPELSRWRWSGGGSIGADFDSDEKYFEPDLIVQEGDFNGGVVNGEFAAHIARHDPARVLAECEAKRRIIELHASGEEWCGWSYEAVHDGTPCDTLRALALPYAGHPDYRDEWRMS